VDTFGTHLNSLLKGTLQHSFALLLFNASKLAEGCYRYRLMQRAAQPGSAEHSFPFRRFHFSHSSSRGQAFLKFATKRLPELAATVDILDQVDILTYTNATWKDSINKITLECRCERCRDEEMAYDDCPPQFCLELIAEIIIIFLWIQYCRYRKWTRVLGLPRMDSNYFTKYIKGNPIVEKTSEIDKRTGIILNRYIFPRITLIS
jgi:hypothetical protein